MPTDYPDISAIFQAKEKRRRALAALTWEEKIAIVERMRKSFPKGAWIKRPKDTGDEEPLKDGRHADENNTG